MATVTALLNSGTRTTINARQFSWLADEPEQAGGTDQGPTPYEILLGALASCITTTLRLYSDYKGIPLEGVDVSLEFDRVHAEDCLECDNPNGGMIDRIKTKITLRGTFTDAQRTRLAQVAERCPVHKTLVKGIQIFDSVSFES